MAHAPSVIVIAHRGASGERPEHTLESYSRAIAQGADYIEPDLVMTRDGVLIARHENEIGGTTDVAGHPEFAQRRRTQLIDGEAMTGWFTEDFTLAEIKTLRARERLPALRPANCAFDGRYTVPTFVEIMELAQEANRARVGRPRIGVYPETKHPAHFARLGLAQEAQVLQTLGRFGYAEAGSAVFIQSFDPGNLRQLRGMTRLPLVQLLEREIGDLSVIAQYANAIGIAKALATAQSVAAAHRLGLAVHVWTFRAENEFLPEDLKAGRSAAAHGDLRGEIARYLALGIDGFFTDFPAIGVQVRDELARARAAQTPGA
ncbi:MAG TPA: glycerophosphodiester phosphodiesterase family protein [Steroidobacteraceae bacterium]|nr:glycerophosphodiester phosphodiesterase family protein [Steroidobacteraceae bacterium]